MEIIRKINYIITFVFALCYLYQFLYIPIALFFKKKTEEKKETKYNRYAVLIAARNEENVIGDLIASIKKQTYPWDFVKTFVLCDNCSDHTKEVALSMGATVYTRENREKIGKGYALTELISHIREDYPDCFDGYFVFDADNILSKDYIEKMNLCFNEGHEVITSYRNSKNYGINWISAGYALWFLRESKYLNYPRYLINSSSSISGTGFLFSDRILKESDDWKYHLLTEDIEFTADLITRGEKVSFCKDAVFYDEQPTTFKDSWNQRIRWTKGYIQVIEKYGKKLMGGILKGSFSCFDITMNIAPAFFLSLVSLVLNSVLFVYTILSGAGTLEVLRSFAEMVLNANAALFTVGFITTITEWKQIKTSAWKKIFYIFTFPIFMFTFIPISITALFTKGDWKPIRHMYNKEKFTEKEREIFGI